MSTDCLLNEGLKLVKRSPIYRTLHPELSSPRPSDRWHEGSWVFCVFDLLPLAGQPADTGERVAVFAANVARHTVESVKIVTTYADRDHAEVQDLALPIAPESLPLPEGWNAEQSVSSV